MIYKQVLSTAFCAINNTMYLKDFVNLELNKWKIVRHIMKQLMSVKLAMMAISLIR